MNRTPRYLSLLLVLGLLSLSACGQSGDLYLPYQAEQSAPMSTP